MKANIKKTWIKALRSGEYKQGRRFLAVDERYCCLGVLYDACVDGDWERSNTSSNCWGIPTETDYGISINRTTLSDSVRAETELTSHQVGTLIGMNDDDNKSFDQIADYIENDLLFEGDARNEC